MKKFVNIGLGVVAGILAIVTVIKTVSVVPKKAAFMKHIKDMEQ